MTAEKLIRWMKERDTQLTVSSIRKGTATLIQIDRIPKKGEVIGPLVRCEQFIANREWKGEEGLVDMVLEKMIKDADRLVKEAEGV